MNIDDVIKEIENLKTNQSSEYYDELYKKIKQILDGKYPEEDKEKIIKTGRISTIYMLSSFS